MMASNVATLAQTHQWLIQSLASANQSQHSLWKEIKTIVRRRSTNSEHSWKTGADDARSVLLELGRAPGPFSFDNDYDIWNTETVPPSSRIEGCVGENSPSCVVISKRDSGKKFLLARALGHFIADTANKPTILSKLRTPEQSRARSFAAELLAPSEWLKHKVGTQKDIEQDQIYDLAEELGVSELAVRWQIENHEIARISHYPE